MKSVMKIMLGLMFVLSIGAGYGAYLDAEPGAGGNTVRASDGDADAWWVNATASDGLWGYRAFGYDQDGVLNGTTKDIYEGSGTGSGEENAVLIITTISGLNPGLTYKVDVVYWSSTTQNWSIRASFDSSDLPLFDRLGEEGATAGVAIEGSDDGDRLAYTGLLGYTTADANGEIKVYIDDKPSDSASGGWYDRSWYDGLFYEEYNLPSNPSPYNGQTDVPLTTAVLSFTPRVDPNNPAQDDPAIVSHVVYFDNDPNLDDASDLIATLPIATHQTAMPTLSDDQTYYWRVDEYLNSGQTITGAVWTFQTPKTIPVILEQPDDAIVDPDETVIFAISVQSQTDVHCAWYQSGDAVSDTPADDVQVGTDDSTLTISNANASDDEGYYYCIVTNDSATPIYSNVVVLGIQRKMAHWPVDGLVGGQYEDTSGEGHHADPNGVPVFETGKVDNAVQIDSANGYASSGTWNPSEFTGQFSFSLWAKWSGQTNPTTWQGLISKEVSFGADTMMWQLEVTQAVESGSTVVLKNGLGGDLSSDPLTVDTWEHIAVTFDGTTAVLYRNGSPVVSGGWSMGSMVDAPLNIGASANADGPAGYNFIFNGSMDDIRVYNYALDALTVAELFTEQSPGESVCLENPTYDFSGPDGKPDCKVNLYDFMEISSHWLDCNLIPQSACGE